MTSDAPARSDTLTLWTIRAVVLVAFLDLFMQLPVVATYAASLGATAAMIGLTVGMYSATNLFGNLGAGMLLDRIDRKLLILVGMLLTSVSLFGYGFLHTPEQLLALRAVHGLCAGTLAPGAFAMLGDRTRRGHTRSMGLSGALIAFAAVVGPPLSGMIGERYGFGAVFMTSGTLMLIAALVFLIRVPGSSAGDSGTHTGGGVVLAVVRSTRLVSVFIVVFVMTFGIGGLTSHLPLTIEASGGSARLAGVCFALFSLVAAILMGSPLQRRVDGGSRGLVLAAGLGLLAFSGVTLGVFVSTISATLASMVIFGLGFGLLFPSLGAAVSQMTSRRNRGTAFGIFYAVYSLGVFLGATVYGGVNDATDGLSAPFYVGAALALAAVPIAFRVRSA